MTRQLSRRDFLKLSGATSLGLALSACGISPTPTPTLTSVTLPATATQTSTAAPSATATSIPTSTSTPTLTATPMPPTIGDFGRKKGIDIGVGIRIEHWSKLDDPRYVNALLNFSMIQDGQASSPWFSEANWRSSRGNAYDYLNQLSKFTRDHHMSYSLDHLFWEGWFVDKQAPLYYLLSASNDQIETWMRSRVKRFFAVPYFNQANFANEAINTDWKTKQPVWNSRPSPMYKVYGQDWPEKAYRMAWDEAIKTTRRVGEDIHLVYNTAGLEMASPRADYEYKYLADLRAKLSQDLGIARPFDIGMQFHIRLTAECGGGGPQASDIEKNKLVGQLRRFGDIGNIRITEFSICGAKTVEEEKAIMRTVVEAAVESQVCKSFLFWDAFAPLDANRKPDDIQWSMRNLFDKDYQPSYMLSELYRILQT